MKDECDFQLLLHFKRVYPSNKALFHLFLYVKVMNIHDKTLEGQKIGCGREMKYGIIYGETGQGKYRVKTSVRSTPHGSGICVVTSFQRV